MKFSTLEQAERHLIEASATHDAVVGGTGEKAKPETAPTGNATSPSELEGIAGFFLVPPVTPVRCKYLSVK